jgi:uridine phosphorylase
VFLDALREAGWDPGTVPEVVINTYARFELYLATVPDLYTANHALGSGPNTFFLVNESAGRVGVNCLPIGAPAAVDQLAKQSSLGVRRFISIGTCGGLTVGASPGEVIVATSALREEGCSYHFLPPADTVEPSASLSAELEARLADAGMAYTTGPTWTTDVPFRTTADEVREYRNRGVLAVEMEAAALFAAAQHYEVEVATALVLDSVADRDVERWTVDLGAASARLRELFSLCVKWLASL